MSVSYYNKGLFPVYAQFIVVYWTLQNLPLYDGFTLDFHISVYLLLCS